jgi:protein arginine N-methyltransferase 3
MAEVGPVSDNSAPSSSGSSEADILDLNDDEGWEDAEPEIEENTFISLFDDEIFTDAISMLNHCKAKYNFDFLETRQRLGLDFYGNIKLVNFIRSQVHSGLTISSAAISKEDIADDKFLKPILEDDALLFSLDELPVVQDIAEGVGGGTDTDTAGGSGRLAARVSELEEELKRIQSQFDSYRVTVKHALDDRWNEKVLGDASVPEGATKEQKRDDDSHYFTSYSYNGWSCFCYAKSILMFSRYP